MLYRLPGGGELIDSPGVRRYAPSMTGPSRLDSGFVEFRRYIRDCRFADCRHECADDRHTRERHESKR